jgi:hypothetical protein
MKQIPILVSKVFLLSVGGILLWLWLMWMFAPESAQSFYAVSQNSLHGINSLKSDFGGVVLALGIFISAFVVTDKKSWGSASIVLLFTIAITRSISLVIDGFTEPGFRALVIELLAIVAIYILGRNKKQR